MTIAGRPLSNAPGVCATVHAPVELKGITRHPGAMTSLQSNDVRRITMDRQAYSSTDSTKTAAGIGRNASRGSPQSNRINFFTVASFHYGNSMAVRRVNPTDFTMLRLGNQGAAGFTWLDPIFTASGHTDTSFVLAGYTCADLTGGKLGFFYGMTACLPGLPGSQSLTIRAN